MSTLDVTTLKTSAITDASDNNHGLWVYLTSGSIGSAVASFDIDIESYGTSGYDRLLIEFDNITVTTDNANVQMTISDDSGSTFESTGYKYAGFTIDSGGALADHDDNAAAAWQVTGGIGNAANESGCSVVELINPYSTADAKHGLVRNVSVNSTPAVTHRGFGVQHTGTAAIDQLRLAPSGGNLDGGTWRVYGRKA